MFARGLILLVTVLGLGLSCSHRSFRHGSTLFAVPLNGGPKQVPKSESETYLSLEAINPTNSSALFEVTHRGSKETIREWVLVGDYFKSAGWFGTRGLRLNELHSDNALLQRFWAE